MATFYCLHGKSYKGIDERVLSLKKACHSRNVNFVELDSEDLDFTNLPKLEKGDMLYNVARGGEVLETLLLSEGVRTFYTHAPLLVENNSDTVKYSMVHERFNLPAPKTVFENLNDKSALNRNLNYLGGFPIIIKTLGGTKGVGTVLASDSSSFYSITDLLFEQEIHFILREYIEPKEIARLIVIGKEVVASNKKLIPKDDFRSSVDNQLPIPTKYSNAIEQLAIKAAHTANMENCGVDILIDLENKPYILEVNMPHDFVTTEEATGIDISGMMIDHLLSKE